MFGSGQIGSVWVCVRGLEGLGAALDLGGFVGAAKFAKGVGFGGQIADEIRAVGAELLFGQNNYAGVTRCGLFRFAPLVVDVAKAGKGDGHTEGIGSVNVFVKIDEAA